MKIINPLVLVLVQLVMMLFHLRWVVFLQPEISALIWVAVVVLI
jgi:hypothetical protein